MTNVNNEPSKDKDYYGELYEGVDILKEIIKKYKKMENIEIELRLGQIEDYSFNSGLGSLGFFNKIKDVLDKSKSWDKIVNNNSEELINNGIRRMTSFCNKKIMRHSCIKKHKIESVDFDYTGTPYDIRIGVAKEIPVEDKIKTGLIRKKERTSYFYNDYRIDLTKVIQIENTVESILFELEVEFINLTNDVSDIYRAHSGLLLIRDIINMCEKIESDAKLTKKEKTITKSMEL